MSAEIDQVLAELKQLRAAVLDLSEQVAALLENGKRGAATTTGHLHIYSSREMHRGEPTIRGSSITVRAIIERTRIGESVDDIIKALPHLNKAQVHDALSYYYDHPEEIETYIRENQEALWRALPRAST